ncbi:primosomal protein DnaI [Enterococcus haemoperoxidus ATCC BAA-382]|uniref:Primosomal protein DnaI n=1 Tax=Enterococcus haemoperoxidus ATCC BAA-382 TaxID=1158608 RepID=R2T3X6_9ENTE|nr:primosomal protein DnaI [Enterococcus haemoperoxidus]EOH99706.1 primosomal protein DnaI [Enterococcus haemoperoxidus ATCC BAA-382]EOT62554.1 primosomal protein DnaI [Enterococcus haemoperoxidus ATCC BAA-382]OJG55019.1 primosomal protein DnaI [Enterococcus haemoperoxidus]
MEDVGKEMSKIIQSRDMSERYNELVEVVLKDTDVQQFIEENRERLTDEDIQKSYSKLYEFVQEKRKYQLNDPTMIAPGYEPQLTLNFHYIDVTYVPTEALIAKQKEDEIRKRVRAMDMPKDVREASLSRFDTASQGRAQAMAETMKFLNEYTSNAKEFHKGLYLQGTFGVGKSFLLGAIANSLAERGFVTTIVHFPTFTVEMKQAIGKDMVGPKLDAVKKSPVLMIDDLGAESMTSWIRDDVLSVILQYRMQEQLVTFFSSNLNLKDLEKHLSVTQRGEQEPLKARRIMERIRYLAQEITMSGNDRRNG